MTVVRARGHLPFALGSHLQALGSPFRQAGSQGSRRCLGQTREHPGAGVQACDFRHAMPPGKNSASAHNPGTRQKFRGPASGLGVADLTTGSVVGSGTRIVGAANDASRNKESSHPRRSR
jgi:hypothetical protein